jgi:PAS domain S-box-containing protein
MPIVDFPNLPQPDPGSPPTPRAEPGERWTTQQSEEKYRRVITNMNLGLVEVDLDERIQYVNQSFCTLSGYTEAELLGRVASELFCLGEAELQLLREKNRSRTSGVADLYEIPVTIQGGRQRWWAISGAPLYDETGRVVGSIGIHLDVTPQKTLELELRDAKNRAEASARAGERFLASMSHEIRTPLSGISGLTQLLQRTRLDTEQRGFVETMDRAIGLLQTVIDDILDLSKINAGRVVLHEQAFSLQDELESLHRLNLPIARQKGLELHLSFPSGALAPRYFGDAHRIIQVVTNLLGNALKFTEQGSVSIESQPMGARDGRELVEIRITDTGIGMDPEFLPALFDAFTQEDGGHARKFGGSGLGMTISQKLARLMGGEILVTSQKHHGTTVRLLLPLERRPASPPAHAAPPTRPRAGSLNGCRILVAEDNEMNALVVRTMLEKEGAEVTVVGNGQQLIQRLEAGLVDLVISDLEMPILGGLEAVRWIRSHLPPSLRVLALTANVLAEEQARCLAAGFDEVMHKPFRRETLVSACLRHRADPATHPPSDPPPSQPSGPRFSLDLLRKQLDHDPAAVNAAVEAFRIDIPTRLAELQLAVAQRNWAAIRRIVHYLESSIHLLSIEPTATDLQRIRQADPNAPGYPTTAVQSLTATLQDVWHQLGNPSTPASPPPTRIDP